MCRWDITDKKEMKKMFFLIMSIVCINFLNAQDAQICPCLIEDDNEALYALVVQQNYPLEINETGPITATAALISAGLAVYEALPDAKYALKVTSGGQIRYSKISSCQMALEKAYDLIQYGAEEVRIISEEWTFNGSCRNRTYNRNNLQDLKERRDNATHYGM